MSDSDAKLSVAYLKLTKTMDLLVQARVELVLDEYDSGRLPGDVQIAFGEAFKACGLQILEAGRRLSRSLGAIEHQLGIDKL